MYNYRQSEGMLGAYMCALPGRSPGPGLVYCVATVNISDGIHSLEDGISYLIRACFQCFQCLQ
jgi:hypothetical protein